MKEVILLIIKYEKMKGVSNGKVGEMERTKIVISLSMLCH